MSDKDKKQKPKTKPLTDEDLLNIIKEVDKRFEKKKKK